MGRSYDWTLCLLDASAFSVALWAQASHLPSLELPASISPTRPPRRDLSTGMSSQPTRVARFLPGARDRGCYRGSLTWPGGAS